MTTKITDRVYLGSRSDAGKLEFENPHGITAIVNVCEGPDRDIGLVNFHIPMADGMISCREFERALDAVSRLAANHNVLIHCQAGVSRSAVVTALYLMRSEGVPFEQALARLKQLRPQVSPSLDTLACARDFVGREQRGYIPTAKRRKAKPSLAAQSTEIRSSQPKAGSHSEQEPEVGIVFLVGDSVLVESTPISKVPVFANCKDHDGSHVEFWEQLRARYAVPRDLQYDDVPRGRVVYHTGAARFAVMLDRCIQEHQGAVAEIVRQLHLPSGAYEVGDDSHYRCPLCRKTR